MHLCAKIVCASLLPLAGPVMAKARAPEEGEGVQIRPVANLFLDVASFDGYAAKAGEGAVDVRLAEAGFEVSRGPMALRLAYDFAGDGEWRDAGVFWKDGGFFIGLGQFKEPASLEKFTFQEDAPLAEPAGFTSAFGLTRRFGVLAGAYDTGWTASAGVFSGSLDGRDAQGRGPGQSALTGRVTANRDAAGGRLHAGAYARRVDYDGAGYVAASYPGSKLARKTLYADFTSEAADGLAQRSTLVGAELAWSRPGFFLQAEAARQDLEFSLSPDGALRGAAVTAGWVFTGEARPYNKVKGVFGAVAPDRPVTAGGPGALIATARLDVTDFTGAGLGRTTRATAGLAWAPVDRVRIEGEATAERGSAGAYDSDTMMVRLRLGF